MSRNVRKPAFCICENKDADQFRGNREADQPLCFRYIDSTIPLLPKYKISSLKPSSVAAQPGLCRTGSENPADRFSHEAQIVIVAVNINQSRTNGPINAHLTIAQVIPKYNHNNEEQEQLL